MKERYARFNEPWTDDETEELRRMAAEGVTHASMSEQLGRTPNAVKLKLRSLGLYTPKPAAKPWTPADEDALVKMYRDGLPFSDMAATFGRSEHAILTRLVRLRAGILPEAAGASAPAEETPDAETPDADTPSWTATSQGPGTHPPIIN